jgi:hypothetical protein
LGLLAGIGFLALNWLGDSLDGTLARVRNRLRPRYGCGSQYMLFDVGGAIGLVGMAVVLLGSILRHTRTLYRLETLPGNG